jgi:hypothetical protein
MNFETPQGGHHVQARTADHPQNGRALHRPRICARGEIRRQIKGWDENPVFLYGNKLEVAVKNGRWY